MELESATDAVEDTREKMRDLNKAKGFYHAVALGAEIVPVTQRQEKQTRRKRQVRKSTPTKLRATHLDGSNKTTSSGSTQQQGTRFKSRRDGEERGIVDVGTAQQRCPHNVAWGVIVDYSKVHVLGRGRSGSSSSSLTDDEPMDVVTKVCAKCVEDPRGVNIPLDG